jgi:hypothetical protein
MFNQPGKSNNAPLLDGHAPISVSRLPIFGVHQFGPAENTVPRFRP